MASELPSPSSPAFKKKIDVLSRKHELPSPSSPAFKKKIDVLSRKHCLIAETLAATSSSSPFKKPCFEASEKGNEHSSSFVALAMDSISSLALFLKPEVRNDRITKLEWEASQDPFIFRSFGFQSKIGSPPDFSKLSGRDDNIGFQEKVDRSEDSEDEPIGRPRILTDIPRPKLSVPVVMDEQEKVDDAEEDEIIEVGVELEGEIVEPDDDPPQNVTARFNGCQHQPPSVVACPPPPASPQRRPSSGFALTSPSRSWQPASSGRSGPFSCGTLETEVNLTVYKIFIAACCTSSGKPLSFVPKSSSNSKNFVVEKDLCAQLQFDERFIASGARIPKGVLLVLPPGSEFVEMFVGNYVACQLFDEMAVRDIMSWSSTTTGYFVVLSV